TWAARSQLVTVRRPLAKRAPSSRAARRQAWRWWRKAARPAARSCQSAGRKGRSMPALRAGVGAVKQPLSWPGGLPHARKSSRASSLALIRFSQKVQCVLDDVPCHPAHVADGLAREAVTPGLRPLLPHHAPRQLPPRPEQGVDGALAALPFVDPQGLHVPSQAAFQPLQEVTHVPGELPVAHGLPRLESEEVRRRQRLETPSQALRLLPGPPVPTIP